MSTQVQPMSAIAGVPRPTSDRLRIASRTLRAAAKLWFAVAVIGQAIFALEIASFYGLSALRGRWAQWNKTMLHGYTPGHPISNLVVAIHITAAVIIMLSGSVQLIPLVQRRAPAFHRWNGRVYFVTAFAISLAGLSMLWFHGAVGDWHAARAERIAVIEEGRLAIPCTPLVEA